MLASEISEQKKSGRLDCPAFKPKANSRVLVGLQSLQFKTLATLLFLVRWFEGRERCKARNRVLHDAHLRGALQSERGAVTAEYAIVIMAAVAFAGLLVVIMRSGEVQNMLTDLVRNALGSAG